MKKIIIYLLSLTIFVSLFIPFTASARYEIDYAAIVSDPYFKNTKKPTGDSKILYPPEEHPYIYVNREIIEDIKANKDSDIYKNAYSYVKELSKRPLPALVPGGPNKTTDSTSRQLEARAFMYLMGELSKSEARELIEYCLQYLDNPVPDASPGTTNYYNGLGSNAIRTGAYIFDWCYDVMKPAQRIQFAELLHNLMYDPVQPVKPDSDEWGGVAGKAVGGPMVFNAIGAAAIYHEMPKAYEDCMPEIQGIMTEAANYFSTKGALSDQSMSYIREHIYLQVSMLFERMGHTELFDDFSNTGYKVMYSRLPYGATIKLGDDHNHAHYKIGKYVNGNESKLVLGMISVSNQNPYFRFQYMKENSNETSLLGLLLRKATIDVKLPDDLPLAFYVDEPRSEIMARTSWLDGLDSPAVVGYISMHNRRTGDHDHADIGNFQLYYKGPLTIPGGVYNGYDWGKEHWSNYLTRSIAANTVTVYEPGETFVFGSTTATANDGGQKMAGNSKGGYVIENLYEFQAEANHRATTEAHYIGPNENTPAFSYIKGDLTKAYSDNKMDSYKRSMVFMDTFNETYPGALIVFDRVVSKNAAFQKKWLLQAVTKPEVEGNKITITNTEEGCNGKLVNTTLYPKEIAETKIVGDIGKYISDGEEQPCSVQDASPAYRSGIRCEVSPKNASKEDIFLNAMYVTDADGNAPELPMIYEETDKFMGVTTLDRQVMFSKTGDNIESEFSITVRDNGYDETLCFVTDLKAGNWKVSGNGKTYVIAVDEENNALTFKAQKGDYTISPAGENDKLTDAVYEQMPKKKTGDFAVKVGDLYQYMREETRLVDGVPYIPAESFINNSLYSTAVVEGNKLIVTKIDGKTATFAAGSKEYKVESNGAVIPTLPLTHAPFIDENGVFYLNHEGGAASAIGMTASYISTAKVLKCVAAKPAESTATLKGLDESRVLWPISIYASSDDGNVAENTTDRDLSTRWSSLQGDGEWICYDLGEEREITGVMIAFYYGNINKWNFDIQISNDGVTFTDVLTKKQSSGTSLDLEEYKFPEVKKARFVRYVGHSEANGSFYNSVTQLVIIK